MAADNRAAKSTNDAEETITVVADGAQQSATSGYQPLSSATATLTSMPLLDIPPGGQYRQRSGSRRSARHLTR
ncbi:TonB-dependent siderophore receptor [Klebsiella pneumoniae]|uniref:TonB-dependent siderophore receptor n=1 Tax=Klebsiella pneumoniae TaxID=573 RepID=A0A3S4KQ62_KLEPN|nr:TonB-dependent siderophore receptor [Klebsiella pneumoniae]